MKTLFSYFTILAVLLGIGCTPNVPLPANSIQFESNQLGMSDSEQSITVKINFTREADQADTIRVVAASTTLKYTKDYTTKPAAAKDTLKLPFAKKATSISFQVNRAAKSYPRSGDVVKFTIQSIPRVFSFGVRTTLTFSFSELTVGKDGEPTTTEIRLGGEQEPNIVFVDLSANRQVTVSRDKWDLGFYAKEVDTFRVILNETLPMMARQIDKTSLADVTSTDTTGFTADMAMDVNTVVNANAQWKQNAKKWIDNPNGNLESTALAAVSATETDNKVYIINRGLAPDGSSRGWKKIRVLRNGNGYELRYANIDEQNYKVWRIDRSTTHLFKYIHFDNGPVDVEPRKDHWDIAFTPLADLTAFGPPGSPLVPYFFKDVVIQSRNKVRTVQIKTADHSYADFSEANLAGLNWGSSQINIGSTWRKGGGPGSAPSLYTDRFYVVRDVQGNIYKIKFTAFTKNGQRGNSEFTYKLVKKADAAEK